MQCNNSSYDVRNQYFECRIFFSVNVSKNFHKGTYQYDLLVYDITVGTIMLSMTYAPGTKENNISMPTSILRMLSNWVNLIASFHFHTGLYFQQKCHPISFYTQRPKLRDSPKDFPPSFRVIFHFLGVLLVPKSQKENNDKKK